ncbi:MAG TPA: thioredoxin domain-containing protein [Pyrinomonadaceae bacterium]|jgi:protein-disulfide isomerase
MNTETNRPTDDADILSQPVSERDHARGAADAPVTLLMYGAYECPHCVEANKIVKEIQSRLGERLRFIFRHFPRTNVHPHAEAAAEVAEAAGAQGKFWEMHDTLFAHFNHLDGEHLVLYARELELDMERFEQAINHRSFAARVQEDFKSGEQSGVRATPTFFINGAQHKGAWDVDALLKAVDDGD